MVKNELDKSSSSFQPIFDLSQFTFNHHTLGYEVDAVTPGLLRRIGKAVGRRPVGFLEVEPGVVRSGRITFPCLPMLPILQNSLKK